MKAIVTFLEHSDRDVDDGARATTSAPAHAGICSSLVLGVRLTAEGANDRLLLRMLELQYPAVRRLSSVGSGSDPDVVELPMPREDVRPGVDELRFSSGCSIPADASVIVSATHARDAGTIRRGALTVDARRWDVLGCRVNGRAQPTRSGVPRLEDIVGGAVVELDLRRLRADSEDDGEFSAVIASGGDGRAPATSSTRLRVPGWVLGSSARDLVGLDRGVLAKIAEAGSGVLQVSIEMALRAIDRGHDRPGGKLEAAHRVVLEDYVARPGDLLSRCVVRALLLAVEASSGWSSPILVVASGCEVPPGGAFVVRGQHLGGEIRSGLLGIPGSRADMWDVSDCRVDGRSRRPWQSLGKIGAGSVVEVEARLRSLNSPLQLGMEFVAIVTDLGSADPAVACPR